MEERTRSLARGLALATILAGGAAAPAAASLVTTETRQTAVASICTDGILGCLGGQESRDFAASVDSLSHASHFDGGLTTPSEARTAARTGPSEIAANASFRHREQGPFRNYTSVSGDALFEWDVLVLNEGDVAFTFQLPPGFLEYQTNAEFLTILKLASSVQVDIQFCSPACDYSAANPLLFQFWATLEGTFQDHELANDAFSVNPALDTSPLTHDELTVANEFFYRTRTWEFEAFTGEIDLGHFTAGETFTLSYRMRAEVGADFPGFETWAAAAINDPFFLATDPLPQQELVSFHFVPEPGTASLLAAGLLASAGAGGRLGRSLRRRDGQCRATSKPRSGSTSTRSAGATSSGSPPPSTPTTWS